MPDMVGIPMRVCSLLFLGVVLLVSACRSQASADEKRGPIEDLPWVSFEWDAWEGVTEKGALLVPVTIEGKAYRFQLDTGADAMIVYGSEAERWGWRAGQRSVRVPAIHLGGADLPATDVYVIPELEPKEGESAGTVGLAPLIGRLVVIDYPGKRFCVVPRTSIPDELLERMPAAPAAIRNGKLFVETKLAGREMENIFFDTGASVFPMLVDYEPWKALTGLATEKEATTRILGSSWGKPTSFVGAHASGELEIGAARLESPVVFFFGSEPDHFGKFPFPTQGLIGNAPFWNDVLILDLGEKPALRILR
jgi:hypothetical protein